VVDRADREDRTIVLARPLSPKACAELAGMSYHRILRAIRGGHLRAFHPPGTTIYRIASEDLSRLAVRASGHACSDVQLAKREDAPDERAGAG
jgi:hypothetical protein